MTPPVQKLASAFLYISQMSWYLTGNIQKRSGLSMSRGSFCSERSALPPAPIAAVRLRTNVWQLGLTWLPY